MYLPNVHWSTHDMHFGMFVFPIYTKNQLIFKFSISLLEPCLNHTFKIYKQIILYSNQINHNMSKICHVSTKIQQISVCVKKIYMKYVWFNRKISYLIVVLICALHICVRITRLLNNLQQLNISTKVFIMVAYVLCIFGNFNV